MDTALVRSLTETVHRVVTERLMPAEQTVVETDRIPDDIRALLQEMGLFGMSVPEAYGGLGLPLEAEAEILFALCRASVAFRSMLGTNNGIGSQGIVIDGTESQKRAYLPAIAAGDLIAAFCLTEPDVGSDAAALRTVARRDGGDYLLRGTKRYITNAPEAGLLTVMARSEPDRPGADGISAFLVEAGRPGLSIGPCDRKMGQRGAHTADVILDDVRVPAEAIIGGPEKAGQGFRTAMKVLDRGRIHLAAVCVGAARRLLDEALGYAMERRQFGQPVAAFQLVQAMLADSQAELYAARCMTLDAARRHDAGARVSKEAACAKMFASEMVGRVADRAVQIHGGAGYMADTPVERLYRDARLFRIYEGTTQIQQLVIARAMIREAEQGLGL
ncbi:acyl-CoA dehydrogenase family protein [Roseospira goensis]|uniref:Acyl-CoA dehydrogenase n=1 Tax=Roseospira goensis TaxID=391922 RepID=A0A7W6RXT3_9PROT|nr:acyl-CoA dehydrogenase family protein [Roseospira goensis]MBB4285188.1 acyl-CoA dehydrogenase [Roseospira goensis]